MGRLLLQIIEEVYTKTSEEIVKFDIPFLELPYSIYYGDWMKTAYEVSGGDNEWVSVWLIDITTFI